MNIQLISKPGHLRENKRDNITNYRDNKNKAGAFCTNQDQKISIFKVSFSRYSVSVRNYCMRISGRGS